jgi:hypothetical protein
MRRPRSVFHVVSLILACALYGRAASAEDHRAQYPFFLSDSFFEIDAGYIEYPFSSAQLQPGFRVESVHVPHAAARVVLLGHHFSRHVSAQLSYARPVEWIKYENVNGDPAKRSVWMNVAGATARWTQPLGGRLAVFGEGGLGIVTRSGFSVDGVPVVADASFATVLLGAGVKYGLTRSWDVGATASYTPGKDSVQQPHTALLSAGFTYNMRPYSSAEVHANADPGYRFPRQLLQLGVTTGAFGDGVNAFVSTGPVPVFWGGLAKVHRGLALRYERNVFHTRRLFSLDWGVEAAYWQSTLERRRFATLAAFPAFRFTPLRTKPADVYFTYSLAGPAFISKVTIDGEETGRHFTFQDFMGLGLYLGRERRLNVELGIAHYSNGNLFPRNAGVSVPLTVSVGRTF